MLFKLFLPILAAAAVYFLGKSHARREHPHSREAITTTNPDGDANRSLVFRRITAALTAATLLMGAWLLYDHWRDSQHLITIRVINAQTGKTAVYQAPKGSIHGRSFKTADGRRVTVADVERIEVDPAE